MSRDTVDFGARDQFPSFLPFPPPSLLVRTPSSDQPRADAKYPVRTMEYISFENLSHAKSSTKGNWIPVRGRDGMWTEVPRFQGRLLHTPLVSFSLSSSLRLRLSCSPRPSPRRHFTLVSQLLFFNASSFLIAANRDVKTIRALLLDSEPDAQFFSRYRKPSRLLVLLPSIICLWRKAWCHCGAVHLESWSE